MKIHFNLNYFTKWGQNIAIMGSIPELGNNDSSKALYMNFQWKEDWMLDIEVDSKVAFEFTYRYVLKDSNGLDMPESGNDRTLKIDPSKEDDVFCYDKWNPEGAIENIFLTSPFKNVLFKQNRIPVPEPEVKKYTHIFRVKAPLLKKGEALCLVGNADALGGWLTEKPVLMHNQEKDWWTAKVNLSSIKNEYISYKYGVYDLEDKQFKYFESG